MTEALDPQARRRAAIVDAAREVFLKNGYGATTMSAIAARVGGSKTTLWAYFPDKSALFAAVVDELVERFGQALDMPLDPQLALQEALSLFGQGLMGIVTQPEIVALHRLVVGEAGRFPELGTLFYERGPRRGKATLAAYLAAKMQQGALRCGDPEQAARQFVALCQANSQQQRLLNLPGAHTDVAGDVAAAVAAFLPAWAPTATPPAARLASARSRHRSSAAA